MRSLLAYLLAVLAIAAGVVFGFFDPFGRTSGSAQASAPRKAPPVVVTRVAAAPFADAVEALGTVLANESVTITARRSDHITALHFEDGQEVEQGALLVELNAAEELAALAEAQALYADRAAAHARAEELLLQNIAPASEVDAARAQMDAAAARVRNLQATISDLSLRAPFRGQLGLRQVSAGAFVQAGTPITTLDDLSVVRVDFTIPETWLREVRVGMPIAARTAAYPDRSFPGEISALDTRLDPRTRSATIRARVPNDERLLRPGMLMRLVVDRGETAVLQVPEQSLVMVGSDHSVFVVDDASVATQRKVQVGRRRVGHVEVLDGVRAGERIVLDGLVRVQSGKPVDVVAERITEG